MEKEQFTSRFGVIMATAAGAVGLGNIWKFPYMLGQNGGAAFLVVYIACVLLFGLPLMITEIVIGKRSGQSVRGAYQVLIGNRRWNGIPILTCLTVTLIIGVYLVITGWCVKYLLMSIVGPLPTLNGWTDVLCNAFAVLCSVAVVWLGVTKGIERLSKIFMPILLLIIVILLVRVMLLPGAKEGLSFLFSFDADKISFDVILSALGQCFYSLSIGMGALITYGSYIPKKQNVVTTACGIVAVDTLVAVMSACVIMPAVFIYGFSPEQGPKLVFSVLPVVFEQMPGGHVMALLFFALLCIAAITSIVSLFEVLTASLVDVTAHRERRPLTRHQALVYVAVVCLAISGFCTFSMTGESDWLVWRGKTLFDGLDVLTSSFMLPMVALSTVIFFGWFVDKQVMIEEMKPHYGTKPWAIQGYYFLIRWCFPILILLIGLNSIGII